MEHKNNMDEICSQHPHQPLNMFCEDCDLLICVKCGVSIHESHKFLTLSQKCKELVQKLESYQKKHKKLEWQHNYLESCTDKVKQTIHRQYSNVKKWLFEAYQRQISEIDNIVNVQLQKNLQADDHLKLVSELLLNRSHSSSFLWKSKEALKKINAGLSTLEITLSKPTYVTPNEKFQRFSEEWMTLSKDLFGQCSFYTTEMNKENYESPSRTIIRSQSLVEIPTFITPPQKQPSELLSQKSVSGSMSSLPLSFHTFSEYRSTAREELRARDQSSSEDDVFEDAGDDSTMIDEMFSDRKPSALVNTVMDFLRRLVRMVALVKGEACIIQGKNSQVKLHVPQGVYGAIIANIHTNHTRFMHHVPENDCLVAPICEYHLQQPYHEQDLCEKYGIQISPSLPEDIKYNIEIPHSVKDVDNIRPYIRVRHGNLHSGVPELEDQIHLRRNPERGVSFDINKEFVTIQTNHFSGYLVTAEGINCCGQSALAHMFGSLVNDPNTKPLATVKVYLSSIHSKIEDYQIDLKRREQDCENPLLLIQSNEISLSTEKYDASKSQMKLTLEPENDQIWKGYKGKPIVDVKPLNKVLKYSNGHICKLNPTEVTVFYLESSEPFQKHLRVGLEIFMIIAEVAERHRLLRWILNDKMRYTKNCYYRLLNIHGNSQAMRQDFSRVSMDSSNGISIRANTTWENDVTVSELDSKTKELTDSKILKLSGKLTKREDLRKLAVDGLDMDSCQVDALLENNRDNIGEAAYSLLSQWRKTQKSNLAAYMNICDALQRVGMQLLINELQ